MRHGKGAIEAGFTVFNLIMAFICVLLGLIDLYWSLAFAILLTLLKIFVFGVKKGIVDFIAFLIITLVMALILLVITLVMALIGT